MKLVMTLLARDEADIVDAQIAFHLNAGVDFVVATDNGSGDGTIEILERYRRMGRLHLIHEPGNDVRQGELVTGMARLAAIELGADWVINSDADEFWWPRGGTLKDVLALVPPRFGVVRGAWRHFLPRPAGPEPFYERMTVRRCRPAFPGDKETVFHAHQKVAHRATPDVVVADGNHDAVGAGLEPLRAWHPIEVLHFSLRSPEQAASKSRGGWQRDPRAEAPLHWLRLTRAAATGRLGSFFESLVVDDETLGRGLADGSLAVDTRLRDALREIRSADGSFDVPAPGDPCRLSSQPPSVLETAAYLDEISPLVGIDGIVRAEERADALEARLEQLRSRPAAVLGARVTATAGALRQRRRLARR